MNISFEADDNLKVDSIFFWIKVRKNGKKYLFCHVPLFFLHFDHPRKGGGWRGKGKTSKAPPVKKYYVFDKALHNWSQKFNTQSGIPLPQRAPNTIQHYNYISAIF